MNQITPVKKKQCRSYSAAQIALLNKYYQQPPVVIDQQILRFEQPTITLTNPSKEHRTVVELTVHSGENAVPCILKLCHDQSDVAWWHYQHEARVLAWCAGHDAVLKSLQKMLLGDVTVESIKQVPQDFNGAVAPDHVAVGFSLSDTHQNILWDGVVNAPEALVDIGAGTTDSPANQCWQKIPACLPINLARLRVDYDQLAAIEVGGFIKLDLNTKTPFDQLVVGCDVALFTAQSNRQELQILAVQ